MLPHYLCPLRLQVPPRPGEVAGTHALLAADLVETQTLNPEFVLGHLRDQLLPDGDSASVVLERERAFRDRCQQAIGAQTFQDVVGEPPAFVERVAKVMGWQASSTEPRNVLDDLLLATASSLRAESLFLPNAQLLRMLALGEVLVRQMFRPASAGATLQSVYSLISQSLPALQLLSFGDTKLKVPLLDEVPRFGDPALFSCLNAIIENVPRSGVLPAFEEHVPRIQPADRMMLAHYVGAHVLR